MDPDPTVTDSWDYLIELTDDGKQPDTQEPEIILPPPGPQNAAVTNGGGGSGPKPDKRTRRRGKKDRPAG
jgi:hypothetical protein